MRRNKKMNSMQEELLSVYILLNNYWDSLCLSDSERQKYSDIVKSVERFLNKIKKDNYKYNKNYLDLD